MRVLVIADHWSERRARRFTLQTSLGENRARSYAPAEIARRKTALAVNGWFALAKKVDPGSARFPRCPGSQR